ncbi:phage tail tape measure protein, partial [Patescibacteria group bacterium]|nr:phage tail tape measure protein [Patescibacteria group bacterium]
MATGLSAVGAGMAFSVKQGLSMEDALAKLSAQSGITGNDLESLRLKAEKSAIAFRVEAPDAVDATRLTINALGLDLTKNIPLLEQMTTSVMTLAKASGLDAAQAADSASTAFNMFGHSIHDANAAEEFQKITNVLAAGARQARTQIPDLVQELSYVGPEAHKAGLSIEETISAMEALGHAGIKPEQVGAEFRAFIMQLEAGSKKAQDALGRLDLTFYDINPTTVGFSKSIHTLKEKLDEIYDPATKVGDATKRAAIEQEIFQRRTSSLAEAMFANVDVFDQYTQAVTGTHDAEDMASKMTHTLSQDFTGIWEKIKTEGIDAFYQYRSEIEKVPGVIDKEIPKLFALLDVLEKVGGSFYHVWQLAENLDNAIGMDRDPNSAVDKFYQNVDRALGLQNEHEKTIDAQQRIDAYNKAHALTQQQITEYTNRNAFMDSLGTSPFDANGNPIVTSSVATSGDAFDTKKKKGSAEHTAYEAALDRLRDAYSKRLTIIENSAKSEDDIKKAEQQAELDNLNAQLATELKFKQKTGETKEQIAKLKLTIRSEEYREEEKLQKEAEKADLKAWDEHLKRLAKANDDEEKLQERHAAKRREIETKLQDMQDASIEDKTQREIAQENTRYEREQKTILAQADGTKEMHDLIDKDLEMLEQEHWQKLKDITDEGATKSADSVNKLTESLRGLKNEANSAKEWGTVLSTGLLIAYDMLRESQSKAIAAPDSSWRRPAIPGIAGTGDWTQSLGKGNALDQLFPFHDTPGTLAQSSGKGTIPVGNGNYLVIGRGDDRLVREDKEATNIITYLRALQQYDSAQFEKDNRKKSLGLQATAIGQLLFQGNGLKSEILSMIHDGKSQSDIISALIHSGGNVRDYFAERVGEGIKEYAFKKPTEFALETALGAPIGGAAGKLAEATIGEFEEVADIPLSHAGKHIATYAAEKLAEHFGGEAAASAVFNAVPSFNDSPPFGQISGQKYIVGGAPDDMLIKGTSFVTMLAEGVTKG